MNSKLTDIGFISKAHGFGGEVLCALDENISLPEATRFLFIKLDGMPVPFLIESNKEKNGNLLIKFEDVNDEASARKITGQRLYIETSDVDRQVREIQWDDLVGFEVTEKKFGALGPIQSVLDYPEQMLARCTVNNKEVLFPLNHDFILEIDQENKTILLDLPEGLLGIYLDEKE